MKMFMKKYLSQHNKIHIVYWEKLSENSQHSGHILVKLLAFKDSPLGI